MSYPTVDKVLVGTVYGATDELVGTLDVEAAEEAAAAAQLAIDVAAVEAVKGTISTETEVLGITGTLDVEAAEAAAAAAQLATDVAEVTAKRGDINNNAQILGVFGTDPKTVKTL